ncbi:hypothetical protein F5X99DRAFT_352370 [Biscogniauxia marginata]|nr:hypothetical protein F5X99DRAFT_352370 [Biscogniauxia marginata]
MEALAAVSLAGNILQFVDTTRKLISSSRQLSSLGSKEENAELELLTQELKHLVYRVTPPSSVEDGVSSSDDSAIRLLAAQCSQVAEELLGVLETLKTKYKNGTLGHLESFYKAILSEWKQDQIDNLQSRLDRIDTRIQARLSESKHKELYQRLDLLAAENRRLSGHRAVEIRELREEFKGVFADLKTELRDGDSKHRAMLTLLGAAGKGNRLSVEQMILDQLRFDAMSVRHDTIRAAHEHTLSWLFDTGERRSPATFDDWVRSDDKLYWISGKPGSGKSTLMKFLTGHQRTTEELAAWAKPRRLITAEYFFWNAGKSKLQKSQEGLLRSLVYQVLRQCPDIIPLTYPKVWQLFDPDNQGGLKSVSFLADSGPIVPLSVQDLLDTLKTISTLAVGAEVAFCFFIDGLDEYEGKPDDMIELIRLLRELPGQKLCLSSRPWNDFEQEFGGDDTRKLYMQDLNREDISAYIHDTFAKDDNYRELEDKDTHGQALVQEIVDGANGVFLWVFLVVRSFQEGLRNGDRLSDLQKRLRGLPTDLNEYFERILLSDVSDFYREQSAEMFSVTLEGAEDLPLMAYWFMGQEDRDYAMKLEVNPISVQQMNKRLKAMKKRLNACCKGLLEVQYMGSGDDQDSLPSSVLFNLKVNFLHRTVCDFLNLQDTQLLLEKWCSSGFDSHETICSSILAQIKISPGECEYWSTHGPVDGLCRLFDHHYRMLSQQDPHSRREDLRKELSRVRRLRGLDSMPRSDNLGDEEKESTDDQGPTSHSKYLQPQPWALPISKKGKLHKSFGKLRDKWFSSS